jgi:hypothetical protein
LIRAGLLAGGMIFLPLAVNGIMERNPVRMEPAGKGSVPGLKIKPVQGIREKTGASAEEIRKAVEVVGFDRAKVEEYIESHRHQS